MSAVDRALSPNEEHAYLRVGGRAFEVVSLAGEERVGELFRYEITCPTEAGASDPRGLVGAAATIELFDGMGATRTITGIVAEAEERSFDDHGARLDIVVRPAAWALSLGRACRVFQDMTLPDIIAKVVGGAAAFSGGVPLRFELSGAHPSHVYCAEYREDDWSFVRRLMEEEGMYAWFDHAGDATTMVVCDDSTRAPDLTGGATIAFAHETGTTRPVETILSLGHAARVAPGKFTVGSFNHEKPKLAVKGGHGDQGLEIYEAQGGAPDSPEACAALAKTMAEGAKAASKQVRGTSTSVRLVPGMIVEISGHPLSRLEGRYLVVESSCTVTQRRRGRGGQSADERPYLCRFRAVPAALPFRLPRVTPKGKQAGLQLGVVVGPGGAEVHPDAGGRVRVQHHWDREGARDEKAGKWMRVSQRGTADSMLLPRMGWNVATFHEEGEIDAPSVLSRLHDAEHPPAYPLPANKTRTVWKTATTPGGGSFNEVRFEDKAGSEEMFINASKDQKILVQNDRGERVSRDASRKIGHDHTFHVMGNYADTVKRDQAVTIGNDEHITVHGLSHIQVTENETVVIGGRRSVEAGKRHLDQVQETRKLSVGAAQIDTTLGLISSTAKTTHILVGGAMVRASMASITESHGWIGVQTIGGAKIELVKTNRVLTVKKNHLETVGGALMTTAGGNYRDHAEKTSSFTVGGAMSMAAPVVVLEAEEKIELSVGGTVLTITPDEITIKATNLDLSAAKAVVVNTAKASHN